MVGTQQDYSWRALWRAWHGRRGIRRQQSRYRVARVVSLVQSARASGALRGEDGSEGDVSAEALGQRRERTEGRAALEVSLAIRVR